MATTPSNIIPLHGKALPRPGGREAWAKLLESRYRQGLGRYLARLAQPGEDVEDIVQEAFYRVLQSDRLPSVGNPGAFLFTTARNLLVDRYRRQSLEQSHIQQQSHFTTAPPEDSVLEYNEMVLAYRQALSELPERCRQVFLLRRYDGLSNSEIADTLNISMRMVQKHLARALDHFQRRLR